MLSHTFIKIVISLLDDDNVSLTNLEAAMSCLYKVQYDVHIWTVSKAKNFVNEIYKTSNEMASFDNVSHIPKEHLQA